MTDQQSSHNNQFDVYEDFPERVPPEDLHRGRMERHADDLHKAVYSIYLLQVERRDADRIQVVEIRKELTGLRRDLNWLLLVVLVLTGYILYKY